LKAAWRKQGVTQANYATLPEKHPLLYAGTLLVVYVTGGKTISGKDLGTVVT
jgi:hypothetical protein